MFDSVAQTYDKTFTYTSIGKALRKQVYQYLQKIFPQDNSLQILELNCGTGEDAIYFAKQGHFVAATDISEVMIKEAGEKVTKENLGDKIRLFVADARDLSKIQAIEKFDLVFSNFGGLNCLASEDLKILSHKLNNLLATNGRFISIVMPKFCLWESVYFMTKFRGENILRRNTNNPVAVQVGNDLVNTWYYSPGDFKRMFNDNFRFVTMKPIGFVLPPSYMESFFAKRPNTLKNLEKAEDFINGIPILSYWSDHFLIDFRKR